MNDGLYGDVKFFCPVVKYHLGKGHNQGYETDDFISLKESVPKR